MSEADSLWTNEDPRLHLASWGGEGAPLLLLHGMGGNTHWWDKAAPLLTDHFRPVALDFHGHGESDWLKDGQYTTESWMADIEEARHALGWPRMFLCAHSLGARIALEYAATHAERLLGLIVIDFLPELYESKAGRFEKTRSRAQPVYADREIMTQRFHLQPRGTTLGQAELKELAALSLRKTEKGFTWKFDWRAFRYSYGKIWPVLGRIQSPTMVVRGGKSAIMDHAAMERCASLISGAKGVEIPEAHHHVPLDAPQALADAALDFARWLPSAA